MEPTFWSTFCCVSSVTSRESYVRNFSLANDRFTLSTLSCLTIPTSADIQEILDWHRQSASEKDLRNRGVYYRSEFWGRWLDYFIFFMFPFSHSIRLVWWSMVMRSVQIGSSIKNISTSTAVVWLSPCGTELRFMWRICREASRWGCIRITPPW